MINSFIKSRLRGEFKAILYNADGSIAEETDWNSNIIVDNGLIIYGTTAWYTWCTIGSNSTGPATSNTTIGSQLGSSVSGGSNPMPFIDYPRPPVAPDWERYSILKWRFDAGNGTGLVNEFTVGAANGGTNIFCRHVLPSTITKGADQALDIFYRFYVYIDSTAQTGSVTVDGINYDWEFKPVARNNYNYTLFAQADLITSFAPIAYDDSGVGGTDTSVPTGDSVSHNTPESVITTGSGSGYKDIEIKMGLDQFVTATDEIRYIVFYNSSRHVFQLTLTATSGGDVGGPLPKDETEILTFTTKLAWGRYP